MEPFSGLNQPLKRNLTLFYGITLGLALLLAVIAVVISVGDAPGIPTKIDVIPTSTQALPQANNEVHSLDKPTTIPEIPPTPNEVTPSTLGVTSADLRGVQVTIWHPWTGATGATLKTMLDEYSRTNQWGITVNINAYEGFGSLDEAMDSAIISGTLPDLVIDYGYQARAWGGSGVLADLTPYVQDPLWGFTSGEQADFYPTFWSEDLVSEAGSSQMKRLGIPFYRSAYALFYNQTWARELGYNSPPSSAEAFKSQACSAAGATATNSGVSASSKGGWLIRFLPGEAVGWIYAFGGEITNPNGTGYLFSTPGTNQAFMYIKDLVDQGCAWSDPGADPLVEFASRGALFMVGSLYDIPEQLLAFSQAGNSDQWSVIPFPSRKQPVVDSYGPSIMITHSTPAKQLASWLVVKWLVYPHNQIDWVNALGVYPTRQSSAKYLSENPSATMQSNQALEIMPVSRGEPTLESWNMVRWTLNDALTELADPKFTKDQIPSLLEMLDKTVAEIINQVP